MRTATRIRWSMALGVVASLLVAVLGWQAAHAQAHALTQVSSGTQGLVAVEQARNALVAADATATNAFLVGGLEPLAQRQAYDDDIAQAAQLLSAGVPAGADPDDLAAVTADLARYTGLVEQARAANRQGLPVGAAYLDQASTLLRSEMLPRLDAISLAAADSVAADFGAVQSAPWLLLVVLAGLLVLLVVHVRDSRRTHRVINPPLTIALVVVVIAGAIGTILLSVAGQTDDVRSTSYRSTLAISQATASAYDAQAMESFTLIRRGSGAAYEAKFVAAADETQRQLDRVQRDVADQAAADFAAWRALHEQVRALDDGGDWDGAVALVLSDAPDAPAAAFTTFTTAADDALNVSIQQTTDILGAQERRSTSTAIWLAIAGLAAAVLTWRGLARRLGEYR
jgi:hypothetical protein